MRKRALPILLGLAVLAQGSATAFVFARALDAVPAVTAATVFDGEC